MHCRDAYPEFEWFGGPVYYMHDSGFNYSDGLAFCRTFKAEYPTMHDEIHWKGFKDFINHSEKNYFLQYSRVQ